MNKIGVADFGMNMWDGGAFDAEQRWMDLKSIGYDGVERLHAHSEAQVIYQAARMRKLGVSFATVQGPSLESTLQWSAALGCEYVWINVQGKDFDTFCRQAEIQAKATQRWGLHAGLHNHMGTPVETQAQLVEFLQRCPNTGLILDTAHLAAMGGNPAEIVHMFTQRLLAVHLKDWILSAPNASVWHERGRFCRLGEGNIGLDNAAVLRELAEAGYEGWIFVEQDTHLNEPLEDLARSRDFIRSVLD